jgi:integrase
MKTLRQAVNDYFELRHGLGFKLQCQEIWVRQFVKFLVGKKTTRITSKLALEFATQEPGLTPKTYAGRLSAVRGFARYRLADDPTTEIAPAGLLPFAPGRARPYLYSQAEIRKILDAARNHPSPRRFQARTYYCVLGLLAVSGMRIGEVLNLMPADVDWAEGLLTIRNAKYGKSRLIPLHRSTIKVLKDYVKHRDRYFAQRPHLRMRYLFPTSRGTHLSVSQMNRVFVLLSQRLGLRAPGASRGPRLHDYRHRFAVETLLRWYRRGASVEQCLPVLSTYLGHTHVTGTYWYLSSTPALIVAVGHRLERRWKGVQ